MQHVRALFKLNVLSWAVKHGSFSRDVAFTLFAQMLALLLHTGNTAILAHWLGPEGKGMLDVALLVPGMLGLLVTGGLGIANVYYAGSRRLTAETLIANSVATCILATLLGYMLAGMLVVSGLLSSWLVNVPLWLIGLALFSLPLFCHHPARATAHHGCQYHCTDTGRGDVALEPSAGSDLPSGPAGRRSGGISRKRGISAGQLGPARTAHAQFGTPLGIIGDARNHVLRAARTYR